MGDLYFLLKFHVAKISLPNFKEVENVFTFKVLVFKFIKGLARVLPHLFLVLRHLKNFIITSVMLLTFITQLKSSSYSHKGAIVIISVVVLYDDQKLSLNKMSKKFIWKM